MSRCRHPDDDLLPDVAPFGQTDGTVFDACLERNRVFIHVHGKRGLPPSTRQASTAAGPTETPPDRQQRDEIIPDAGGHHEIEAADTDFVAAQDVKPRTGKFHPRFAYIGGRAHCLCNLSGLLPSSPADRPGDDACGRRAVDANLDGRSGVVLRSDIFAEHKLLPARATESASAASRSTISAASGFEHSHVGDHSALRGQIGRIAAGAFDKRGDVVREQALQIASAIRAGYRSRPRSERSTMPAP